MVSPTATDMRNPAENAFTLWARDRRHTDVARDVAQFLSGDAGLTLLGVLYPFGPLGQSSYQSFEQAARQTGAAVVAASGYRPWSVALIVVLLLATMGALAWWWRTSPSLARSPSRVSSSPRSAPASARSSTSRRPAITRSCC